ncbi:hypothetical protein BC827DRAFT_816433 [Russula dissimulans]|nr:hypothetical protein BC827DRAFT_816433 [Russula dissimulans]
MAGVQISLSTDLQCEQDSPEKATAASSGFRRNGSWRRLDVSSIETACQGLGQCGFSSARGRFWGEGGESRVEEEVVGDEGQDEHVARADKSMSPRDGRLDSRSQIRVRGRSGSLVPRSAIGLTLQYLVLSLPSLPSLPRGATMPNSHARRLIPSFLP